MKNSPVNFAQWDTDEFEDQITRTFIAIHERAVVEISKRDPRLTKETSLLFPTQKAVLSMLRKGVYVPTDNPDSDNSIPVPRFEGLISFRRPTEAHANEGVFLGCGHVGKITKLPRYVKPRVFGKNIAITRLYFTNNMGVVALTHPKTVVNGKLISWTSYRNSIDDYLNDWFPEDAVESLDCEAKNANSNWRIRVVGGLAPIDIGCTKQEIKSLLYARSLPLTASGRKRPILHLVGAHRRRLKEGVEVDIESFLRGTRDVDVGGTRFSVIAPESLEAAARDRKSRVARDDTAI